MEPPPGFVYEIVEGVRRCTAARLQGLPAFPGAIMDEWGLDGPVFDVPLELVYSPKKFIPRFDAQNRYLDIERGMADPDERRDIPYITLKLTPDWLAKLLTKLADVQLVE